MVGSLKLVCGPQRLLVVSAGLCLAFAVPVSQLAVNDVWKSNQRVPSDVAANTKVLYKDLYNSLYEGGYHKSQDTTHAREIVQYYSQMESIKSVLDVGCSTGRGVQLLWGVGKAASGVDIADLAIKNAYKWRCRHTDGTSPCDVARCGADRCFQVGSATDLPVQSKTFDAIMSTDVLEHILKSDVPVLVKELTRVARQIVTVKVASMHDLALYNHGGKTQNGELRGSHGVKNLHVTTEKLKWWVQQFEEHANWRLKDVLSEESYKGFYKGFTASFVPAQAETPLNA